MKVNQFDGRKTVRRDLDCLRAFERSAGPFSSAFDGVMELEHGRWDPKDGELCLDRTKPEETLVEVRSGSDVQIDRQI